MRDGPTAPHPDTGPALPAAAETMAVEEDLPPPDTVRWVARRKAQVVAAIEKGRLTVEEACGRYNLSLEEVSSWRQLITNHGTGGLRVTRLKDYRAPSITTRIEKRGRKPRSRA